MAYIRSLRRFFPAAIGARDFVSGSLVVLFRNQRGIEASWLEGCELSFGLLRLGYDIAVHYTAETFPDGDNVVTESPEENISAASLGLKLEFTEELEGVCVPTHAYVDVDNRRIVGRLSSAYGDQGR